MVIAITCLGGLETNTALFDAVGLLHCLTVSYPQHQFHLVTCRPVEDSRLKQANLQTHLVPLSYGHSLWLWHWLNHKLPAVIKKLKANAVFSLNGQASLSMKTPQCLFIKDPGFLSDTKTVKNIYRHYQKKNAAEFMAKAKHVLTTSISLKEKLLERYKIAEDNISVVTGGTDTVFAPVDFELQNRIKDKYTSGCEYFLLSAVPPQFILVNLLKAFSVFKRRLQSSMKLVIASNAKRLNELQPLLQTYKYKEEVVLLNRATTTERAEVTTTAYAFINLTEEEGFNTSVAEAMRSGVPVLTVSNPSIKELAADAALYFDTTSIDDIAEKLMRSYKNEEERKTLLQKGLKLSETYSWHRSVDEVWKALLKTAEG